MRVRWLMILLGIVVWATACTREENESLETSLILYSLESPFTRAADPDETRISDYNLLIYNCYGDLEQKVYVPSRALQSQDGRVEYSTTLLQNLPYTVLAAANLGYELPCLSLPEALEYRYYLAYPDEYSRGMPMASLLRDAIPGERLNIPLERLMARIDVQLDSGALPDDAQWLAREIQIGNCPLSATLFSPSTLEGSFSRGFRRNAVELNTLNSGGTVSFYLLEELSGRTSLEIKAEYHSEKWNSAPGEYLSYRVDLGAVQRNTRYSVTLRPAAVPSGNAAGNLSSKVFSVRKIP